MARETKIGILAVVAISVLIWGYEFLKGKNILASSQIFYVEYDHVDELAISNPVLVNGFQVGIVKDVYLKPQDLTKIVVELDVRKDVPIPRTAIAQIRTTGMMGGRAVVLKFEGTCSGDACASSGDHLPGETVGFLNSMVGTDNVETYLQILREGLKEIVDTLLAQADQGGAFAESIEDVKGTLANLNSSTRRLDQLLAASSGSIQTSLQNVASITGSLEESNAEIKTILSNVESLSSELKEAQLGQTVSETTETIRQFQGTLKTVDQAVADLSGILAKIDQGDNTLGMLVNDPALYDNLTRTLLNMELLLQDVRLNPKRYTRILSKKQKPYEKPEEDPGLD